MNHIYGFIVLNYWWNSEIVPKWIQQKISRKVTETELSKTAVEFENCKQQSFTLTMCLSACLWAQIAKTLFNYYQFQRLILQFPALGENYGIASMFILTRGLRTPRDVERRERGSMFCETNYFLKFEWIVWKAWKQRWKVPLLNNEIHSFCSRITTISPVSLFAPQICTR